MRPHMFLLHALAFVCFVALPLASAIGGPLKQPRSPPRRRRRTSTVSSGIATYIPYIVNDVSSNLWGYADCAMGCGSTFDASARPSVHRIFDTATPRSSVYSLGS
ncbi:hypothetical protein K458DRAFT_421787 [Lentithecium fluviatile CBS 122367]|uniref:Uncharacterized protein n=1 Tax=Lentithecium fluviatile CBS 122367 TaxID=1168545 RepID=A0A6G1IQJ6_9PLEO|nr:hypothetical protein K458DRAFT_421787 [Lentithecium fluviatile CBS 122367]